jgi:hypothetical protein
MRISQSSAVNTVLIDIHDYRERQKCGFRQASMQQMARDIRGCFGPEVPVRYDSKYKNAATDLMAAKSPLYRMLQVAKMSGFGLSETTSMGGLIEDCHFVERCLCAFTNDTGAK